MKKRIICLISCLIVCLLVTACGKTNSNETVVPESEEANVSVELKEPVMEWWELYNPNGFDTVTALITNPNNIPVDVSYDLVFYKDGSEVSRIEYCLNESIMPNHKDIVWANVDVPSSADADDVKMENVLVTEAYATPVEGTYEFVEIKDNEAYYNFKFEKPIEIATIWFLFYNDNNNNNKFDKGEIVVTELHNLLEQEGIVSYETDVYPYTNCDIYFKAY